MFTKLFVVVAVLTVWGCAAVQVPAERLESTGANIRGAEELGAMNVSPARLHLQLAKEQTETAKVMAANGDHRSALVMARAESDAELALGMAREVSVHADAQKAAEDLKAVQARGTP